MTFLRGNVAERCSDSPSVMPRQRESGNHAQGFVIPPRTSMDTDPGPDRSHPSSTIPS